MPNSNMPTKNVILLDDVDKMPLDEAMNEIRELMLGVSNDLHRIINIVHSEVTEDDREAINDYLERAFGDWQASVQGSLEEVAYVFNEAWSKCYDTWRRLEGIAKMQIGTVLPNGATVVEYTVDHDTSLAGGVVLCTANGLSADPFVTWNWWANPEGEICCSTGHYFDRLEPAVADFKKRALK